jgi:hypothetical protein
MTYSWIATSSYNTALQRMSYFVVAKTIERSLILSHWDYLMNLKFNLVHRTYRRPSIRFATQMSGSLFMVSAHIGYTVNKKASPNIRFM